MTVRPNLRSFFLSFNTLTEPTPPFSNTYTVFLPPTIINETQNELDRFGREVLGAEVFRWVSDAERNVPFVRGRVQCRTQIFPFERAGSDQVHRIREGCFWEEDG